MLERNYSGKRGYGFLKLWHLNTLLLWTLKKKKNNVLNAVLAHVLNDLAADLIHLLALLKVDDF